MEMNIPEMKRLENKNGRNKVGMGFGMFRDKS